MSVEKNAVVIVAHPDDETIWAGGTMLMHPEWEWIVVSLCRGSDPDRAPKFKRALEALGAGGRIGDLDDGPEQLPLADSQVQETILGLLPKAHFDIVLTHSLYGEYTRHRRHEEIGRAVAALWSHGDLSTDEVWMFAYEDGGKQYLPRAIRTAHELAIIPSQIWDEKNRIITRIYGFAPDSFEARATAREEAFWRFRSASELQNWQKSTAGLNHTGR